MWEQRSIIYLFGLCPGGREISTWIENDEKCSEAKNCAVECKLKKLKKDEKGGRR